MTCPISVAPSLPSRDELAKIYQSHAHETVSHS